MIASEGLLGRIAGGAGGIEPDKERIVLIGGRTALRFLPLSKGDSLGLDEGKLKEIG